YGNGIELVDDGPTGVDADGNPITLTVQKSPRSLAAVQLGLVPAGADQSGPATLVGGTSEVLTAADTNPQETHSVFNTVLRLRGALNNNNLEEIGRTLGLLQDDLTRLNFGRAEIGARQQ